MNKTKFHPTEKKLQVNVNLEANESSNYNIKKKTEIPALQSEDSAEFTKLKANARSHETKAEKKIAEQMVKQTNKQNNHNDIRFLNNIKKRDQNSRR